jgi:hypothetical protein
MPNYRRAFVPGECWFFTVNLLERRNAWLVKHDLVSRVGDWPYSSVHRDVRERIIPEDWAGEVDTTGEFGERVKE